MVRSQRLGAGRQEVEQHVEAHVEVLAHADRGAEEDEPAHHQDRGALGPARRGVQHVAGEHLPGDQAGHHHEPDARELEREAREAGKDPRRSEQSFLHGLSPRSRGSAAAADRRRSASLDRLDALDQGLELGVETYFS